MHTTSSGASAGTTVVGVFPGFAEARRAVEELRQAGYRDDQIGLLGPDHSAAPERSGLANDPTGTRWEEGAGIGAAAGGVAGLGLGLAVAAGLLTPLGPVVAGGAALALLASAGTGAAVGSVVGALCGLGIPEEEARLYADDLGAGRVVVAVREDVPHGEAAGILRHAGGTVNARHDIGTYGTGLPATPY